MSQSSQIYVRFQKSDDKKGLIARYYGWVYGERMVCRARYAVELILSTSNYRKIYYSPTSGVETKNANVEKLTRFLDVNFDYKDIIIGTDIIEERAGYAPEEDFADYVFYGQQNDDGKLFIDITEDGTIKYAFLNEEAENPMDAEAYMEWDCHGEAWTLIDDVKKRKVCKQNIKYIMQHATLMTSEEVLEFIEYNYEEN